MSAERHLVCLFCVSSECECFSREREADGKQAKINRDLEYLLFALHSRLICFVKQVKLQSHLKVGNAIKNQFLTCTFRRTSKTSITIRKKRSDESTKKETCAYRWHNQMTHISLKVHSNTQSLLQSFQVWKMIFTENFH